MKHAAREQCSLCETFYVPREQGDGESTRGSAGGCDSCIEKFNKSWAACQTACHADGVACGIGCQVSDGRAK